jgi:serine protease Do
VRNSQAFRVYDSEGKSINLSANGGGAGGKTGLYAVPVNTTVDGKAVTLKSQYYKNGMADLLNDTSKGGKYSASGVEGLAFAIPIDSAYPIQLDLMKYGYVRGVIDHGLTLLDVTQENLAQYHYWYGIDKIGVYVVESKYAEELMNSDRILSINDIEVETVADVKKVLSTCQVGDILTIVADRKGETVECVLTLQEYVPDRIKDSLQ